MKGDLVCKLNKELALMREQVERLKIERDEAKVAADFANLACDRKDYELQAHKEALEKARVSLEVCQDYITGKSRWVGLVPLTKTLSTINQILK